MNDSVKTASNPSAAATSAEDARHFKSSEPLRTPLYQCHLDAGGKMVDFSGWEMPVNYGSQIEEHHAVRQRAGMFDVSHMTIVDLTGADAAAFLSKLLANDIAKASATGKALYSCMLDQAGGVVDDLIAYHLGTNNFRLVVNAGTREKDLAWLQQHASGEVTIRERPELAMLAVQGPDAAALLQQTGLTPEHEQISQLPRFYAQMFGHWFVARTGYTGEDGFEIALPAEDAAALWRKLIEVGVEPCGLGSRDTLRLEAGMNLYGNDMDESITPLDCGLAWTVAWQPETRDFTGRAALEQQLASNEAKTFCGLILQGRGVLRHGQKIYVDGTEVGVVTSGSFSPTLQKSIAFASLQFPVADACEVEIRNKLISARIVKLPFYRQGKVTIDETP